MSDFKLAYDTIMELPFIAKIIQENKVLKRENNALKKVLYLIPDLSCKCNENSLCQTKCCCKKVKKSKKCLRKKIDFDNEVVIIKQEKNDNNEVEEIEVIERETIPIIDRVNTISSNKKEASIIAVQNFITTLPEFQITKKLTSSENETIKKKREIKPKLDKKNENSIEKTHVEVNNLILEKVEQEEKVEKEVEKELEQEEEENVIVEKIESDEQEEVEEEVEEEVDEEVEEEVEEQVEEQVEEEVEEEQELEEEVEEEEEQEVEEEVEEIENVKVEKIEAEAETEAEEQEEDDQEVFEIDIEGVSYYTDNEISGKIYKIDNNEEVGDEIGVFVNSKPKFHKK